MVLFPAHQNQVIFTVYINPQQLVVQHKPYITHKAGADSILLINQ